MRCAASVDQLLSNSEEECQKMKRLNFRGVITSIAVLALAVIPLISQARPLTASIRIVNNSNRTIRNVYLSHVDADDWSANQLGTSIGPGESNTISNLTWDQSQVKVVGEDQDGCFLTSVVPVADNSTWTITNDTAADCGSGVGGR
jgi:hypothetical protein